MKENTYRTYLLSMLLVILAFNYVDRLTLGLVLQEIKLDLDLSDTQLGVLSGIAFALFYSVMGIPIARWADRGDRVKIISITTLLWSVAMALCGLTGNFMQLLLIRVGVAVGEAGCIPPAHSLIADYFTRAERPKAVSRYLLGGPLSAVIGFFVAGWLNELYGWRMTFVLLGLPGLALAGLAWFSLRECRREPSREDVAKSVTTSSAARDRAMTSPEQPTLSEVSRTLWANTTFRHLLFNFSVTCFFNFGIVQWQAAFFIRKYGLATGELGTWLALIYGLCGLVGMYLGGEWAARRAAHNERLQLEVMALGYGVFSVISAGIYLTPNLYVALALMALGALVSSTTAGPLFATIQTLVPQRMRAMSIALLYFFANLIGMGLGPLAAGALSDALRPFFGGASLGYALLALSSGYLWGGWHLWQASKHVTRDLATQQARRDETHGDGPNSPGAEFTG